jgi:hypothetical protein
MHSRSSRRDKLTDIGYRARWTEERTPMAELHSLSTFYSSSVFRRKKPREWSSYGISTPLAKARNFVYLVHSWKKPVADGTTNLFFRWRYNLYVLVTGTKMNKIHFDTAPKAADEPQAYRRNNEENDDDHQDPVAA